ncbi:MAG: M50 family metallopeptidase, partial [Clostridium fessum]
MVSLLAALIVFSLIVLFHEFGHFLLAKRGGICVVEFSLGMGPRLFSFVKGGTRYSLKLLPFGGSCMMLGKMKGMMRRVRRKKEFLRSEPESDRWKTDRLLLPPGATGTYFNAVSAWTRFKVVVAGPVFNFILAWFCAFFVISCVGFDPASVVSVEDGYPAQEAGLQAGDTIERLNGTRTYLYRDVQTYLQFHPGKSVTVEYVRDGKSYTTQMVPHYSEEAGRYLIGISGGVYQKPASVIQTAQYSFYEVRYWIRVTFSSLGMILKRQVSSNDIAGPVRIVSMIGTTVKESQSYGLMIVLVNLANMCILLSANLGVMNLLPVPALDGGRLVFIILEMLRGKPVDPEKEGMVH